MDSRRTIEEIKERLHEEGYTAETIGEVLREVNRSFLADDAREIMRQTQIQAARLQAVLQGIYAALIAEPVLDLKIDGEMEFAVGGDRDAFDILVTKLAGERLAISFRSRHRFRLAVPEAFSLGDLAKQSTPEVRADYVVILRIVVSPDSSIRFEVNRVLLEDQEVKREPHEPFDDCLTFLDFASDRYNFDAYPALLAAVGSLSDRVGTYLSKKREFLDRLNFG